MGVKETLIWICSLAVLSTAAQDETLFNDCGSLSPLMTKLSDDLKAAAECSLVRSSAAWSGQQSASLLLSMRNTYYALQEDQLKACHGPEPRMCPAAEVPSNGGLVCARVCNNTYCKPMCNHGYDFGFLRKSRVFDRCTEDTGFKWETQYIGGNSLAVCNKGMGIAGASSAYFPENQDCLTTKSDSRLQNEVLEKFAAELKEGGVRGEPHFTCLVCG